MYQKTGSGSELVFFYGINGDRLRTYTLLTSNQFQVAKTNIYFSGRLIWGDNTTVHLDRLGSVRNTSRYYPFGEEQGSGTIPDKFATYYRDTSTGLDYAMNRYYGSSMGRFTTPDPYGGSANPGNAQSWNRYAYVTNDPINNNDPSGLIIQNPMFYRDKSMGEGWLEWLIEGPARLPQHSTILELIQLNHEDFSGAGLVDKRLDDPDCAKALGFSSSEAAIAKFNHTRIENKDLGGVKIVGGEYTFNYGETTGGVIFLNNNSAFNNLKVVPIPVKGAIPANALSDFERVFKLKKGSVDESIFQAIYIAHELGHIGKGLEHDVGFPGSEDVNEKNTSKVLKGCFKDLLINK